MILQQLAISGGIFLSYILDYIFFSAGWGWRPMFAAAVIPGIALAVGMLFMTHTPRWLAMQGRWDEAEQVMGRVNPRSKDDEMALLHDDLEDSKRGTLRELMSPGVRGALIAGLGLAALQQFVGPNTVLFYGPTIFGYAGISAGSGGLIAEILVGAVLFVCVLPTIALVDMVGRKKLFYLGLTGMGSTLVLLGLAFHFGASGWGLGVLAILLVYIGAYSLSISPLFWLMTAELYPNRLRGIGASTATVANWSANLLISVTFLSLVNALGKSVVFWIYAVFAAAGIVFVRFCVPETKGRSLEDIDDYWTNGHRWPEHEERSRSGGRSGSARRSQAAGALGAQRDVAHLLIAPARPASRTAVGVRRLRGGGPREPTTAPGSASGSVSEAGPRPSMSPRAAAQCVTSWRELSWSLRSTAPTWDSTVRALIPSRAPICL